MTRELITELANTLERMDGWLKVRHVSGLMPDEIALVKEARQYLASAREKNMTTPTDIKTLQAEGKGPAPCARFCEATAFNIEIAGWRRDQAENLANQCKLVDQITALTAERDALKTSNDIYITLANTAYELTDQRTAERDALKNAARLALDALECSEAYVGCESWSPSMLREVQETIAALKAVL